MGTLIAHVQKPLHCFSALAFLSSRDGDTAEDCRAACIGTNAFPVSYMGPHHAGEETQNLIYIR